MSTIAIMNAVTDQAILVVPDEIKGLPDDVVEGLSWWMMIEHLAQRRRDGQMRPVSPLFDVRIDVIRRAEQIAENNYDHDCYRCTEGRQAMREAMEEGTVTCAVIVQFSFKELVDVHSSSS